MSVTEALAEYVTHSTYEAIPRDVRDEAKRAIFNYLGCALGGAVEPALDVAIKTLAPFSGNATACVLGRAERFDALHAALLNGIGSHVHEYDDTLPKNYIHPSVPVASALFAYASANPDLGPRLRARVHPRIRGRIADRQRRLPGALLGRLAHHVDDGRVRRGSGHRQAARPHDEADGVGVRPRRDASGRPPRDVRLDGEVVSTGPRRAERLHGRAARPSRFHGRRAARSKGRAASRR